jgi:RNA polymerase sigma-70 factor, ECF subfamily
MIEAEKFEQFMRNYQNMVFSTAVRLLASEAEAQDVSQEVFLKAYERFAELSVSPTAGGWLKAVTTNLCLNHLTRYRNRWRFFSEAFRGEDDDEEQKPAYDVAIAELTTEELNEADQRRILEDALTKLPEGQRVPLVLYHFEEKSYEEIAAILKISLSKVKTDIMRGREALKKKLLLAGSGGRELTNKYNETQPGAPRKPFGIHRLFSPNLV